MSRWAGCSAHSQRCNVDILQAPPQRTIVHSGSQCHGMLLFVTSQVIVHKPHVRLVAHLPGEIPVGVYFNSMNETPSHA